MSTAPVAPSAATTATPQPLPARVQATIKSLHASLPPALAHPKLAIVCGSGLGGLADTVDREQRVEIRYSDVPGFPISTVQGHDGKLVFGTLGKKKTAVVLLVGRAHYYEGHNMDVVTYATRVCSVLGVKAMIGKLSLTNAAGGLNPAYSVGDIVLLNDHINLAGLIGSNPLRGPNESAFGTRFPPLSDAYDLSLRRLAHNSHASLPTASFSGSALHEGVYAFSAGPTYETRAECRALRMLGADVVGMSTVPEIIVARHCGMRVLAFSLVTNKCVLDAPIRGDDETLKGLSEADLKDFLGRGSANHEEVLEAGRKAAEGMQALVKTIVEEVVL